MDDICELGCQRTKETNYRVFRIRTSDNYTSISRIIISYPKHSLETIVNDVTNEIQIIREELKPIKMDDRITISRFPSHVAQKS